MVTAFWITLTVLVVIWVHHLDKKHREDECRDCYTESEEDE